MSRAIGLLLLIPMCRAAEPTPRPRRRREGLRPADLDRAAQYPYQIDGRL